MSSFPDHGRDDLVAICIQCLAVCPWIGADALREQCAGKEFRGVEAGNDFAFPGIAVIGAFEARPCPSCATEARVVLAVDRSVAVSAAALPGR